LSQCEGDGGVVNDFGEVESAASARLAPPLNANKLASVPEWSCAPQHQKIIFKTTTNYFGK
jgi:hypothetical protein